MDLNLNGKRALVCGASQGIGKATAIELAQLGAQITVVARNPEKLQAVVQELNQINGLKNGFLQADFSKPEELKSIVTDHLNAGNQYQILVNNTGGPPAGPAHLADVSEFEAAFNAHLVCNHILAQALIPGMRSSAYGRIINVISTSVKQPLPNLGVSNTIRGAVANWSKTLANELGVDNITVNNVLPGATETERLTGIIAGKASKMNISLEEASQSMSNAVPMKRFAKPEEIASAIAFLASPAASYINGINVPVDGGRTSSL